jgi:hypothetical protein
MRHLKKVYLLSIFLCLINSNSSLAQLLSFPEGKYTPNGYISNPYHTAVLNPSGVLRSVPPLGFGFWLKPLPWPYGSGFGSNVFNYLSLIHLSLDIDGKILHSFNDFDKNAIELYSGYHTENIMSYNFETEGLKFEALYFQVGEHSLLCKLTITNNSGKEKKIRVHASNIYGDCEQNYWGKDGVVSQFNEKKNLAVSKIYAAGTVFVLGSDRKPISYKATGDDAQWNNWISKGDLTSAMGPTSLAFNQKIPGTGKLFKHMISMLSYEFTIGDGKIDSMNISLSRGLSELSASETFESSLKNSPNALHEKYIADNNFYKNTPILTGDWPKAWKNGMIYDFETLRMNIHDPIGIYKHHWDGMQVHTPRVVLGESAIDCMSLSYADVDLTKDVLLGTFADAPAPNIPCSREDGSLNMICGNGKEAGTAPIWGLPFHVIRSIYMNDGDDKWIKELYPHLKEFIEWWLENRTDKDGWLHCACSWESGQDADQRFKAGHDAAASAEEVRTIDIEAAMANALENMVLFAKVAGEANDVAKWESMAKERTRRVREMFVDGRFRDFDATTGKPIILENYYSVMMLTPISLGIATKEQMDQSLEVFEYFKTNHIHWLDWPSFLFPFSEAVWNAGQRKFIAEILVNSGDKTFRSIDFQRPLYPEKDSSSGYNYQIPGVAHEFWPYLREKEWAVGCENYGWGATFPALLIRNIIGFRKDYKMKSDEFILAPALPSQFFEEGKTYGMTNLNHLKNKIDLSYSVKANNKLEIEVTYKSDNQTRLVVLDEKAKIVAKSKEFGNVTSIKFNGRNYSLYTIRVEPKI